MSTVQLNVRPASLTDAGAIARAYVTTWRATYAGMVPESYLLGMTEVRLMRHWRRTLTQPQYQESVLVAEVQAADRLQIVGFGSCGSSRSQSLPYRGEVYTLYVLDDWQDRGIGRALIAGLFQDLVARGHGDALIWVLTANPSRFFYEAVGGSAVAERRETFAGAQLTETGYAWPDLIAWLSISREREGRHE